MGSWTLASSVWGGRGGGYNGAGVLYGSSFINVLSEPKRLPLFDSQKREVRNVESQGRRGLWAYGEKESRVPILNKTLLWDVEGMCMVEE